MPAWLIPALKAVLPHVGSIVSATTPVFTKKKTDVAANQLLLLQQQITELQAATSANDSHIKELAAQIENTVAALEKGASISDAMHKRLLMLAGVATALSLISLGIALFILVAR
ncbi:hypothetical protein HUU05_13920 [candidate division KSB1 bacterium]|nr:hypothetical protein [candidate division KSB1 bacterium]